VRPGCEGECRREKKAPEDGEEALGHADLLGRAYRESGLNLRAGWGIQKELRPAGANLPGAVYGLWWKSHTIYLASIATIGGFAQLKSSRPNEDIQANELTWAGYGVPRR